MVNNSQGNLFLPDPRFTRLCESNLRIGTRITGLDLSHFEAPGNVGVKILERTEFLETDT